ncbi:MAG: hypothetical protein EOO61_01695 [Hymenobacter sp.]|nr:MAG: hypothetical protein EOO61_01695 [Hymenobacter sp.]
MPLEENFTPAGPSWNEVFHGPAIAAVMDKLKACLLEVEKKHQEYFDELSEQADEEDRPVRLHNFTTEWWHDGIFQFGTKPELRQDIADECVACVEGLKKQ